MGCVSVIETCVEYISVSSEGCGIYQIVIERGWDTSLCCSQGKGCINVIEKTLECIRVL